MYTPRVGERCDEDDPPPPPPTNPVPEEGVLAVPDPVTAADIGEVNRPGGPDPGVMAATADPAPVAGDEEERVAAPVTDIVLPPTLDPTEGGNPLLLPLDDCRLLSLLYLRKV